MSISAESDDATLIASKIVQYLEEAEASEYVADLYIKGCEALWTAGTPKEECGAKFAKIIRDKKFPEDPKREWHSGHYWAVVKKGGYTRSGTPAQEPKTSSPVPLKLELEDPTTWPESPNYKQRLPFIQFLKEDLALTSEMLSELQKNYEDKEEFEVDRQGKKVLKDGKPVTKIVPDLENPRAWHKLFSATDAHGNVTADPPEVVDDFFKVLRNLRAKMQNVMQMCMDGRQLLMPWMIFPLKARADIISKAYWGKQYYVHFKRRFTITTKKITQFEESVKTYADYLRWVGVDAWQWGYSEFIPCSHCIDPNTFDAKEKAWDPNKAYRLEMFPYDNGTWQWHCSTCGRFYNPELMTQMLEQVATDKNGMATIYLQRAGVKIPEETEEEQEVEE